MPDDRTTDSPRSDGGDGSDPRTLPQGSVVPGADIWDDDDDPEVGAGGDGTPGAGDADLIDLETRRQIARSRAVDPEWDEVHPDDVEDDDGWLTEAQVVAHAGDDGAHDGSRGVEADDDDTTEAFGSKLQRWTSTSMLGAGLSGIGIGIDRVINGRTDVQIEIEVDDDSDDHLDPVEVKLGKDPEHSVAVLRPWLRDAPAAERSLGDGPVDD